MNDTTKTGTPNRWIDSAQALKARVPTQLQPVLHPILDMWIDIVTPVPDALDPHKRRSLQLGSAALAAGSFSGGWVAPVAGTLETLGKTNLRDLIPHAVDVVFTRRHASVPPILTQGSGDAVATIKQALGKLGGEMASAPAGQVQQSAAELVSKALNSFKGDLCYDSLPELISNEAAANPSRYPDFAKQLMDAIRADPRYDGLRQMHKDMLSKGLRQLSDGQLEHMTNETYAKFRRSCQDELYKQYQTFTSDTTPAERREIAEEHTKHQRNRMAHEYGCDAVPIHVTEDYAGGGALPEARMVAYNISPDSINGRRIGPQEMEMETDKLARHIIDAVTPNCVELILHDYEEKGFRPCVDQGKMVLFRSDKGLVVYLPTEPKLGNLLQIKQELDEWVKATQIAKESAALRVPCFEALGK